MIAMMISSGHCLPMVDTSQNWDIHLYMQIMSLKTSHGGGAHYGSSNPMKNKNFSCGAF